MASEFRALRPKAASIKRQRGTERFLWLSIFIRDGIAAPVKTADGNLWPLPVAIISSLLIFLSWTPASVFAQPSPAIVLRVSGEVRTHLELSASDLAAFQRKTISVDDDHGTRVGYGGVDAAEILRRAGAPLGKELKGPNMTLGVVAIASDGYRVLFSLTEFDAAFKDRAILVADRRDGKPLDEREGPIRLVVAGDKRHARWVRKLTTLDVVKVR